MRDTGTINFRFKFVNKRGVINGIIPKLGTIRNEGLILNHNTVYLEDIYKVSRHDNKIIISFNPYPSLQKEITENIIGIHSSIVLKVNRDPQNIKAALDQKISVLKLNKQKQELTKEELGYRFRTIDCPTCKASLNLTDKKDTRYIYCEYCETIFDRNQYPIPGINIYKICPECGYYGRIRNSFKLSFHLLYKDYQLNLRRYYCCDTCTHKFFINTALKNLSLFIGFVIVGIEKLRSLRNRNPAYPEITTANFLAQENRLDEGNILFGSLLTKNAEHPGLNYNYGLGYFLKEDMKRAFYYFNKSLEGCSNYKPVLDFLEKHKEVVL